MMSLGPFGNGGSSSSSSNLSALAPPFAVDRSNHKPISNPPLHFSEPPYAAPFSQTWQYPHSSAQKPDFFSNRDLELEVDSTRFNYLQLANDRYPGSDSINPPRTHWYSPSPSPSTKAVTDASYYPESKPVYSSYVSTVVNDDTPLVALNEPSYDSLSTSGVVPMNGQSQVDYIQSWSGLDYMPQQGSFWNGLTERKQGKQIEVNVNFCSEETSLGGSHAYKNYTKQGTPISRTSSIHPPVEPSSESATNLVNHQKPYSPYRKWLQPLDSSMNDCISVTKSSPSLIIRPPAVGTISSAPSLVSPKTPDIGNIATVNTENFDCNNATKRKELHLPLAYEGKEGHLGTRRINHPKETKDYIFASCSRKELSNKPLTKDAFGHTLRGRSGFQAPDINVQDGFPLAVDSAVAVKSTENSSDSLDSPCWKGAPASYFSSLEAFEASTPQPSMKKLEACNGLNAHGTQIFPYFDYSVNASSQKPYESSMYNENGHVNNGLSLSPKKTLDNNHPAKEHMSADIAKSGSRCPKLSSSNGVQFSNDLDKPRNEHELPNGSKSDFVFKASHTNQPTHEEDGFRSMKVKLQAGVVDTRMNTNDASEDSSVPFHATENVSCSLSPGKNAADGAKPHDGESTPKMDVEMIVNTMRNLSELLLFRCSSDACSLLKEQDHEALMHVIGNLDACLSKKMIPSTPAQEPIFPQPDTSHKLGELLDLHVGSSASKPQVTNEAAVNSDIQFDCQHTNERKRRNYNVFGKEVDKFSDFVSLRDDADVSKHDNMVKGIEKVLDENFHSKEEMQPQTLLYKNLWLEAEAQLCSLTCRARFDRMKIEMEKSKFDKAKDVTENAMVVEKLLSSNVSPDPNISHKLATEVKDGPILKATVQDSPISSTTNPVDDVEASVMARLRILKCRGDKSNLINMEEQQLQEVDAGFAGKKNNQAFFGDQSEDGILNVAVGSYLQHHTGDSNEDKFNSFADSSGNETVKEFRVCMADDPVIQSRKSSYRLWNELPSGWYDSCSSDWEHVMKDGP